MSKLRNFLINQYNVNILMGIDTPSVIEIDNMVFNVRKVKPDRVNLGNYKDGYEIGLRKVTLPISEFTDVVDLTGVDIIGAKAFGEGNFERLHIEVPDVYYMESPMFNKLSYLKLGGMKDILDFTSISYPEEFDCGSAILIDTFRKCYIPVFTEIRFIDKLNFRRMSSIDFFLFQLCYVHRLVLPNLKEISTDRFASATHFHTVMVPNLTEVPVESFTECIIDNLIISDNTKIINTLRKHNIVKAVHTL